MAHSIDPATGAVRGFVPARNDEERYLMRHIEDLADAAFSRGIARYSAFLSDREQDLARAALGRAGVRDGWRLDGGWPEAERRVLCLEPEHSYGECPVRCVQLQCRALPGAALPAHKDYLGSLMGLALKREALGDILLPANAPGTAYVFALEPAAKLICRELCQAGRTEVSTRLLEPEEIPAFPAPERQLLTATVSSLRLDAVLSAMLHVSRGTAADVIKLAMVRVWKRLRDEKMASRLILTVHDELIVEAPEAEAEQAARILREEMEGCVQYAVPLSTDVHAGKNWLEAH